MLSIGLTVCIAVGVFLCIGALIALVLFGIRRYILNGGASQEEKTDMEWDNSELNITINPLDVEGGQYEEDDICAGEHKIITDDVICREVVTPGELSEDEREEEPTVNRDVNKLEWDDSVLSY